MAGEAGGGTLGGTASLEVGARGPSFRPDQGRSPLLFPAIFGAAVAASWVVTVATAGDYQMLLMGQVTGASVADGLLYVALSAVMMTAMMVPTAAPMVAAYANIERAKGETRGAAVRTTLFCGAYVAVWAAMTALSLVALAAFGLMDAMGAAASAAPGALLVAAGAYQFTGWKAFCLNHCRTPSSFLFSHYRDGSRGALRMGLEHALYCLGCCWLLMLVWFVAGAMSVVWMAVFAALILAEKSADPRGWVSRAMGATSVAVGAVALYGWWAAPVM